MHFDIVYLVQSKIQGAENVREQSRHVLTMMESVKFAETGASAVDVVRDARLLHTSAITTDVQHAREKQHLHRFGPPLDMFLRSVRCQRIQLRKMLTNSFRDIGTKSRTTCFSSVSCGGKCLTVTILKGCSWWRVFVYVFVCFC